VVAELKLLIRHTRRPLLEQHLLALIREFYKLIRKDHSLTMKII
jgi:hypothetical protein